MFKRADWSSGLTYQQTCDQCHELVRYTDSALDFRPWYADGFIYCPRCHKPLRHDERFAMQLASDATAAFCTQCGRRFETNEVFCPQCGNKR